MPSFSDLGVPAVLVKTLDKLGIDTPTPIQAATLPDSLKGRDVLGRGRTGSGKTFAFLLPLVARLDETRYEIDAYRPRSLVLAPTRELANQIADSLKPLAAAAGLSYTTVFGGVGQNPQVKALKAGVDVLIACPGRLEDLMGQGFCDLSDVEVCILDEADHMADMGFLPGVKRILTKVPREAQHLLFSATLDGGIDVLVKKFLSNPVTHQADSAQSPVATMEHHVFAVDSDSRIDVLTDLVAWVERHREPISFPVEVRVAAPDDMWLSTGYERANAYVAVHQYHRGDHRAYFAAFEEIVAAHAGRPHWGKVHGLGAEQLADLYPRHGDFVALRDRLDPERVLTNDYLDRVLGP